MVRDLSLKVPKGEIYGFLGPNGSGKTTTLRMLCGLLTPDAGEGTCLGYDILTEQDEIKRNVGYMTQRFSLYADLSIRENLEFVARVYGVKDPKGAADRAIARLGLAGRKDQLAGELSGGWKQRLALGACILPEPRLLLLDEPTAGVDPKARREFWDEIHGLAAEGITVLVSTHYMDEAERCHEIAYIAFGELLAKGTAKEVVAASGLNTWNVSGPDLHRLARRASGVRRHRHGGAVRRRAPCLRPRQGCARYSHRRGQEGRRRSSLDARRTLARRRVHPADEPFQGQFRMIAAAYRYSSSERRDPGFLRRMWAMIVKEFVQMRRDRMTFATMIFVPILQLVLFGYAINTDPKQLPTAVLTRDDGPLTRAVLAAMSNTDYFDFRCRCATRRARPADPVGRGAVCRRDSGELRARRAARRQAFGAGDRRCHRSGGDRDCGLVAPGSDRQRAQARAARA